MRGKGGSKQREGQGRAFRFSFFFIWHCRSLDGKGSASAVTDIVCVYDDVSFDDQPTTSISLCGLHPSLGIERVLRLACLPACLLAGLLACRYSLLAAGPQRVSSTYLLKYLPT